MGGGKVENHWTSPIFLTLSSFFTSLFGPFPSAVGTDGFFSAGVGAFLELLLLADLAPLVGGFELAPPLLAGRPGGRGGGPDLKKKRMRNPHKTLRIYV